MSGIVQNLTNYVQTAMTQIDNEADDKLDRRSVSIAKKPFDGSTTANFRHKMNENNLSGSGSKYSEEPTDVKKHNLSHNLINPDFDRSTKLEEQMSLNYDKDKVQSILRPSKEEESKFGEEKHVSCEDECICKIKEALGLIVEEIKKVDATISGLAAKSECPYTPKPEDKKEFAKSVEKNSAVCHVIIDELKKQRREINEMLELYEESSREFAKLEVTVKRQREKVEHLETILESLTNAVEKVKTDVAKHPESFFVEMQSRRTREETREEILKVFLNWITSLDAKRYENREVADCRVKEAIEEREKDRAMLTLAIKQLQEVKRIELLLTTQNAITTPEAQRDTMPSHPFCRCALPLNRIAIISGQCNNARVNPPGACFNVNPSRCAGGADGLGVPNALGTNIGIRNCIWYPQIPFGYHKNMHVPMIYQRRVPIGRRKSPANSPRRHRRKRRNVNLENSAITNFY